MSYSIDKAIESLDRKIGERESIEQKWQRDIDDHKERTASIRKEREQLVKEKMNATPHGIGAIGEPG
jgi:prefoldin subunit 5